MESLADDETLAYFSVRRKSERLVFAILDRSFIKTDFEVLIQIAMAIQDTALSGDPEQTKKRLFKVPHKQMSAYNIYPPLLLRTIEAAELCVEEFRPVTPIWIAASKANVERTRELIQSGTFEKHTKDRLMVAAKHSANKTIFRTLIAGGANDLSESREFLVIHGRAKEDSLPFHGGNAEF